MPGPGARAELLDVMRRDKKSVGGLTFVLPGADRPRDRRTIPTRAALDVAFARRGRRRRRGRLNRAMATILLLSGPNLNLFGEREPEIYGTATLDDLVELATRDRRATTATSSSTCSRTTKATLVDAIHGARGRCAAIVINAGAFTHYSYALADALATFEGREGRAARLEPRGPRALAPRLA